MRARRVVAAALALALAQALVPARPASVASAGPGAPNVLIIMTDDQRTGTLGVMKWTRKWFLRGGTSFQNAFVTTPLCCPSRASILTGRYAHNHGVIDNQHAHTLDQSATLQRSLQDAGYLTGMTGKYLNGWRTEDAPPYFHRWAMFSPLEFSSGYWNAWFNLDGAVVQVPQYSTDFIADRAVDILRWFDVQNDAQPWFLYVTPFAPHGPNNPAPRHRKAKVPRFRPDPNFLERDRSDKPPYVREQPPVKRRIVKRVRAKVLRQLMSVDDLVQSVMLELGRLGEREDTLAIFLSDNGLVWGDHGWRNKRLPYTKAVQIPMFVRWPGRVPERATRTDLVLNVDLFPTILETTGASPHPDSPPDGRSLFTSPPRPRLFMEYLTNVESPQIPSWRAIRTQLVHYIEYPDDRTGEITFREYYDLVNDPYELVNLLGDADPTNDPSPDELALLRAQVDRDLRCRGAQGPDACP